MEQNTHIFFKQSTKEKKKKEKNYEKSDPK